MSLRPLLPALALLCGAAPGSARAAELDRALGGRITELVATSSGLAVLRDGAALMLDGDGRRLGSCGGAEGPGRVRMRPRAEPDAEDTLRAAGLPDDDDASPEAEDALEDEGVAPSRRPPAAVPAVAVVAHGLATARGQETIWIATSGGLWRARADGSRCTRAALPGREVALVAAAAEVVVAIAGETVWRSRDQGRSFEAVAVLSSAPRALALAGDGAMAWVADQEGVLELTAPRAARRVLDRRTDAVALCAGAVLALAGDGTYAWAPGGEAARLADRPPARRLGCGGRTGAPVTAVGIGLWTSADGASWVEEPGGLGLSVAGAAWLRGRWWLATDAGLLVADTAPGEAPAAAPELEADGTGGPGRPRPAPIWAAALPRLTVAFGGRQASGARGEWHVWLLVTLPLGRVGRASAEVSALAAAWAQGRAAPEDRR